MLSENGLTDRAIALVFIWQTSSSIPIRVVAGTVADYIDKRGCPCGRHHCAGRSDRAIPLGD